MMRPQSARRIAGSTRRASRTPLSTLTSKKRIQSASGMSSNGLGSKMPRLLTRISMPGWRRHQRLGGRRRAQVAGEADDLAAVPRASICATAASTAGLRAPVDDHARAFARPAACAMA